METLEKPARIWELDFLRGLCVLLMVFDHLCYDLAFVFRDIWFPPPAEGTGFFWWLCNFCRDVYWPSLLRAVVRPFVLAAFIGLCGTSCSFSRSNWKRGLKLLGVALLLSAVTWGLDAIRGGGPFFRISFGILHLLAVAILLYAALRRLGELPMLALGLLLTAAGWYLQAHPFGSGTLAGIVGTNYVDFYSADYFPLLPWLGYFLLGAVLGGRLYRARVSRFPRGGRAAFFRPFYFMGRHALLFYVLHQPAVYLFLVLLGLLVTGSWRPF